MVKKYFAAFIMMAMMALMVPMLSTSVEAQTYRNRTTYKKPNVYDKHRNLINIGIGTGAGALIGALIGGKKGAAIVCRGRSRW